MKTLLFKKLTFSVLLLFCMNGIQAQDINFSQFYDLPILRNPALAGIFTGDIRVTSAYRNQWQSVTVPYRTMALGIEYKRSVFSNGDFITIGAQLTNDVAGDSRFSRIQALPVINYHKSLSAEKSTYLSAGFMAGPVMQSFDPTKLRFDDQYVGTEYNASNPTRQTFNNSRLNYFDPAVGLCFSTETENGGNFYVSAGLFHFTKQRVSFLQKNDFRMLPKYVINAGYTYMMDEINRMVLYADFFQQGGAAQAQGGAMVMHDLQEREDGEKMSISGGLFYRLNDAVIPVVKLNYYNMSVGVTYDVNVSKLVPASQYRGGFEMTLSYKGLTRSAHDDPAYDQIRCPKFF